MRKRTLFLSFLAICALSLAANFMVSTVDTHAQSSQASDQQADRGASQLAPQTGDIRAGRGTYFAVVRHNGFLERSSGVVDVTRFRSAYVVTFNADVSQCAYTATVSVHPLGSEGGVALVAGSNDGLDPRRVLVYTLNSTLQSFDKDFHLIVNC